MPFRPRMDVATSYHRDLGFRTEASKTESVPALESGGPVVATRARIHDLDDLPDNWAPCVVTVGVFDGVHRGHTQLIRRAVNAARRRGLPAVLVTFDPHPALVVGPPRDVAVLTSIPRRADLATCLGIDAVCVVSFTREFARLSPADFVEQVLVNTLKATTVIVGANFTFGHLGSGDVRTLTHLCAQHSITTDIVELLCQLDAPCSSTAVRAALCSGDVQDAMDALGRPHRVDAMITAEPDGTSRIHPGDGSAIPAPGRYLTRVDGTDEGEIHISVSGDIQLRLPTPMERWVSIEFIERLDGPSSRLAS